MAGNNEVKSDDKLNEFENDAAYENNIDIHHSHDKSEGAHRQIRTLIRRDSEGVSSRRDLTDSFEEAPDEDVELMSDEAHQ